MTSALVCSHGIQGRTACIFSQPEISATEKTFAKRLRTCFDICASSMPSVSTLSLRNEFPLGGSARRFLIGSSGRRTASLPRQRCLNKSFKQWVRLIWFGLKFRVILATDKIRMISQLDQFGEGAIR